MTAEELRQGFIAFARERGFAETWSSRGCGSMLFFEKGHKSWPISLSKQGNKAVVGFWDVFQARDKSGMSYPDKPLAPRPKEWDWKRTFGVTNGWNTTHKLDITESIYKQIWTLARKMHPKSF